MKTLARMRVPLIDLQAQYGPLEKEIQAALARVCSSQRFILGPEGEQLERSLAEYCGVPYAIGCASGSDAILLSLAALGVAPGDEVVTTPFSFFASAGSVARLGARAAFVDIDPRTYNLAPEHLETYLENVPPARRERTRAILVVHLYGQPAEMDPILRTAGRYGLPVLEDAAQSIGAEYGGRRVGGLGWAGAFSFYPTKNLGGYGDAGLITTRDPELDKKARALRHHGSLGDRYRHELLGWNSRLDELQAAVLEVKRKHLEGWSRARQERAAGYDCLFCDAGLSRPGPGYPDETQPVALPFRAEQVRHVYNQYVIRARDRDRLRAHLAQEGVDTEIYYPLPLHLQPSLALWGGKPGDYPEAERAAREVLALPLYPELSPEAQAYVVGKTAEFYRRATRR